MKKILFAGGWVALTLGLGSASALADSVYSFSFTGASDSGSGYLSVAPTGSPGVFLIDGINGTTDGSAITGLLPVGTYPPAYPPENDNLLYVPGVGGQYLDESGVSYSLANGTDINLWFGTFTYSDNTTGGPGYFVIQGSGQTVDPLTGLSLVDTAQPVAATPEPDSLILLGTGLASGLRVMRRRKHVPVASTDCVAARGQDSWARISRPC